MTHAMSSSDLHFHASSPAPYSEQLATISAQARYFYIFMPVPGLSSRSRTICLRLSAKPAALHPGARYGRFRPLRLLPKHRDPDLLNTARHGRRKFHRSVGGRRRTTHYRLVVRQLTHQGEKHAPAP